MFRGDRVRGVRGVRGGSGVWVKHLVNLNPHAVDVLPDVRNEAFDCDIAYGGKWKRRALESMGVQGPLGVQGPQPVMSRVCRGGDAW